MLLVYRRPVKEDPFLCNGGYGAAGRKFRDAFEEISRADDCAAPLYRLAFMSGDGQEYITGEVFQ